MIKSFFKFFSFAKQMESKLYYNVAGIVKINDCELHPESRKITFGDTGRTFCSECLQRAAREMHLKNLTVWR